MKTTDRDEACELPLDRATATDRNADTLVRTSPRLRSARTRLSTLHSISWCQAGSASKGFTLAELLVLVGMLSLGALLLAPALARTEPASKTIQCQNNLRQLTVAWTLYAADFQGNLAYNTTVSSAQTYSGWVSGTMDWLPSNPDNTNTALLADERFAKLAPYHRRSARLFKCPADIYISAGALGATRVRSISMNGAVGADPGSPTKASFVPFVATKLTELASPVPARVWVLADEQADSLNDGCLLNHTDLSPPQYQWTDLPASYHNGGCTFSFADSHVELKRWVDRRTLVPVTGTYNIIPSPNNMDFAWVQDGSPKKP